MKKGKPNRHDFEDRINAHAWKSPQWKKKLLTDPKAAFLELTGESVPSEISMKVIEERKKECVIILHPAPSHADTMSEEELRKVAGGRNIPDTVGEAIELWIQRVNEQQ